MTVINTRPRIVLWVGLLAALVLNGPAPVALAAPEGLGPAVASAGAQSSSGQKAQGTSQQAGTPSRGQSSGRPPGQSGPPPTPLVQERWVWWRDSDVKRELGLSEETAKAINSLVEDRLGKIRPTWETLRTEEATLNRMTGDPTVTERVYEAQARTVFMLRAMVDTSRTVMNWKIFQLLRPDQLKKLEQIRDRRNTRSDRGRSNGPGQNQNR